MIRDRSWLDPVRAALERRTSECTFFFRDDDAGWVDDRLFLLLDRFEAHELPADVAVIPAAVTGPTARRLRSTARATRIRLHQHGFSHTDHEIEGRKCEFGDSRALDRQAADIVSGRDLVLAIFGDLVDPVFTPPWNRCRPETGAVLVEAGLHVLSRDSTAPRLDRPGLPEVPVTVDWFGRHKKVPLTRAEIAQRIGEQVAGDDPVGVMLHHAVTDDDELARIDDLLDLVASHPMATSTTIAALARPVAEQGRPAAQ